eukprot:TRINITY_DN11342_c0_g1_i2.p1 TRINITY_DN11342_c0_g1~~TRINITY_DN11342_c0_g1_i2.p1  ORF type:complete len:367 (-),score=55.19 TRINITY_DN11342_c0_g1_i2:346-1446(-)
MIASLGSSTNKVPVSTQKQLQKVQFVHRGIQQQQQHYLIGGQRNRSPVLCALTLSDVQRHCMTDGSVQQDESTFNAFLGWRGDFSSNYQLLHEIGQGSFGVVHAGVDVVTEEKVAVKILPKLRDQISPFVSQFKVRNEVENFLAAQGCASVTRLHGCFEDEKNAYLVMEMCWGGDLKQFLDIYGSLSERESAILICQVFMAIAACHKRSVCFGDVKPANFMFKHKRGLFKNKEVEQTLEDLSIRAVDFGCSQRIIAKEHLTKMTGTPLYMAPEMFMRDYGFEVDIWAAGVLLYQLLTGLPPFWESWEVLRGSDQSSLMLDIMSNQVLVDRKNMSDEAKDLIKVQRAHQPTSQCQGKSCCEDITKTA